MGISIEVDGWDPARKYYGGDTVRGYVVFMNKSPNAKPLTEALTIKFCGKAESHWKEQRRNVSHYRQYMVTTFETEIYFEEIIVLQNKDFNLDNGTLRPGRTEFQFAFQFPFGLPESFKSEHGSVTYTAEVADPRAWNPENKARLEFLVGGVLDLNIFPAEWSRPAQFWMEKSFLFGTGRVETMLSLRSRCFVPLEEIGFTLEVANKSGCYLKKVRVYFCQVTTYKAKGSEFKEGTRLSKIKCQSVFAKGTATIEGTILVPEVPPTELGGCELVKPEYGIMIRIIATSMGNLYKATVLEGRVPIIIGTVARGRTVSSAHPGQPQPLRPISALRRGSISTEIVRPIDIEGGRRLLLTLEKDKDKSNLYPDPLVDQFTNLAAE